VSCVQDELAASGDELTAPPQHRSSPSAVLDPCATTPEQTATVCDAGGFGSQLTLPTGDSRRQLGQAAAEETGARSTHAEPATDEQRLQMLQTSSAPRSTAAAQLHPLFSDASQLSPRVRSTASISCVQAECHRSVGVIAA
jgi:hypothetical protein